MKVVILCGGRGTRLREETEFRPKPMVMVGNQPILWHIMKLYSYHGFNDFVLCLGYKGGMIKDYFDKNQIPNWKITFAETGLENETGSRIAQIKKYLDEDWDDNFLLTYGDGIANIDINKLLNFHKEKKAVVTLTGVRPTSPFGVVEIQDGLAKSFREKPKSSDWVNGGFFVCNKKVFDYLSSDDSCVLEQGPLRALAVKGELAAYCHDDFWQCVDTFKDLKGLAHLYNQGRRPWMVWET